MFSKFFVFSVQPLNNVWNWGCGADWQ